jgi:glycosyltransferase XagB
VAQPPPRIEDRRLPIYTIICALYREERVVDKLVDALRALDYPGIMAQTPLDRA